MSEVGKIWKQFALGLMYRLTGITPPTTPLLDSPSGYSSPFGSPTASRPLSPEYYPSVPSPLGSPILSLPPPPLEKVSAPSSPEPRQPTDIEELYKGCSGGRTNMSILFAGGSGQGKSYTARYLIEALHKRNNYKHFLMITNEGSHINTDNAINFSNVWQTIWWNKLDRKDYKKVNKAIKDKCTEWAKGHTTPQTLVVMDDVTSELERGNIAANNLVTRGHHDRTDFLIVYHGVPPFKKSTLLPVRDNIEQVILTGTDLISKVYERTLWFDRSANTETEIKQHCKSFVVRQRTQAFINRRLCAVGKPLEEYCVPLSSKLEITEPYPLEKQAEWTIGTEPDAKDIVKGTAAYNAMKEHARELEEKIVARTLSLKMHITPDSTPRHSANMRVEIKRERLDDESDDDFVAPDGEDEDDGDSEDLQYN